MNEPDPQGGCPMNRRRFLQVIGAGAAATAVNLRAGPGSVAHAADGSFLTTFGRMFPALPPFATPSPQLNEALLDVGRKGGILDAKDNLSAGPFALLANPALSVNNPDNPAQTAGSTFMGQFLDHDVTFDAGSPLGVPVNPGTSTNSRTPRFDLDTVYGGGPITTPHLYDPADKDLLKVGYGGRFEDLPRQGDLTAIIGDPRNDENVIISGLHCAFLKFHNRAVARVRSTPAGRADGVSAGAGGGSATFNRARQLTQWHYQWMIVHEFLPQFVGQAMVDDVLANGRRFFRPDAAFVPVEFQGAAYRFGHSMVRPSYGANLAGNTGNTPFFAFIFDPAVENNPDPDDLVGGCRAPRRFVGWQTFFNFGDGMSRPNKRIDTKISSPLFNLPLRAIATGDQPTVLPQRTLLRHVTWTLPSGQDIARAIGAPPLATADLAELSGYGLGLDSSTPLFYYVLKEAELVANGLHLGPVGGRIVAEVFLGLLQLDPTSYLGVAANWKPTLPTRTGAVSGDYKMADFLTFAGVDPTSRGQ